MKKKLSLMNNRIKFLELIMVFIFLILVIFLVKILLLENKFYQEKLKVLTNTIIYGDSAPRGRIYDRNYNLLVDNIAVPVIYYKKSNDILSYNLYVYRDSIKTLNPVYPLCRQPFV